MVAGGFDFTGQKVVVIAASTGIGRASAKLFASLGAEVVLASHNQDKLDKAVAQVGHGAIGIKTDATSDEQVRPWQSNCAEVKALFEKVGPYDHLISSSGRGKDVPFLTATPEELQAPWHQKYWVFVKAARHGAQQLNKGGSITFIGGNNGEKPGINCHQAAAINKATEGLAKALSKDLSPTRVNVVSPGVIDTNLWDTLQPDLDKRQEHFKTLSSKLPSKTVGTAEEIARMIAAIASSPFTSGSIFQVNGGVNLV